MAWCITAQATSVLFVRIESTDILVRIIFRGELLRLPNVLGVANMKSGMYGSIMWIKIVMIQYCETSSHNVSKALASSAGEEPINMDL
jgi:hypothetical protein